MTKRNKSFPITSVQVESNPWRFGRRRQNYFAQPNHLSTQSNHLSSGFPEQGTRKEEALPDLGTRSVVATDRFPMQLTANNPFANVLAVRVVSDLPVIRKGAPTAGLFSHRNAIQTGCVIVGFYFFFQILGVLRHLNTTNEGSFMAVHRLVAAVDRQSDVLSDTENELKRLGEQAARARASRVSHLQGESSVPDSVLAEKVKSLLSTLMARDKSEPMTDRQLQKERLDASASFTQPADGAGYSLKEQQTPGRTKVVPNPTVPLVNGAVAHYGPNGEVDYWLIEKPGDGAAVMARVIPLGVTDLGVSVYREDDGHQYIITPTGGWMGSN